MKYIVVFRNPGGCWEESSELFNTIEQGEDWASVNLPYGTLKCRSGEYEVLDVAEYKRETL